MEEDQIVVCEECNLIFSPSEAWNHVQESGHNSWTLGERNEEN